jgi:hypothetical protein
MHEFFPENLRNPARARRVGAVRQLLINQVYSTRVQFIGKNIINIINIGKIEFWVLDFVGDGKPIF